MTNWNDLNKLFLEKLFPASRAASIRKEICGIRQIDRESLHEYWEWFKKLRASFPHLQISEQLLIQYFYEGLLPMDRNIMDDASGEALVDKTPTDAINLLEPSSVIKAHISVTAPWRPCSGSMGLYIEFLRYTTPKLTVKLKSLTKRLSRYWKRWCSRIGRTGAAD